MEIAYIAGFFDGEGCANIYLMKPYGRNTRSRHVLMVAIGQANPEPLIEIQRLFGGSICAGMKNKIAKRENGVREFFEWKIASNKALVFLLAIRPYLIVKAAEVDICIAFQKTMRTDRSLRARKDRVPIEQVEAMRASYFHEIRSLRSSRLK